MKKLSKRRTPKPLTAKARKGDSAEGSRLNFPIVGIGASAGGLEAFTELLKALPPDTGMAFVFIQHLDPQHESMLGTLLSRTTSMPVIEARHGMRVQPDHAYVIPANVDLSLADGKLSVVRREPTVRQHLPVDHFFKTLAETQDARAIGIILSGAASDGTLGLKAIKVAGGITFAQQPETAKFDGMPKSAISSGSVDFVLPPDQIAAELVYIAHHPLIGPEAWEKTPALIPPQENEWVRIFELLKELSEVDFTLYKKPTISRRVGRRMALHKIEALGEYVRYLQGDRKEVDALYHDILIHVTSFFRDPEVFRALRKQVLPELLAQKPPGDAIRIWAPGCSSGEEVYSIAICLLEVLGDRAARTPIQIFGSDISEQDIEKARLGIYSTEALKDVSRDRVHQFFFQVDGHYRVNSAVRDICLFSRHDLTKDPPFSRLDLISCRNVLIYFG